LISIAYGSKLDLCKCVFKAGVSRQQKQAALDYVCGTAGVDCGPINRGGKDFYPVAGAAHQDWAINEYFQEHREDPDNSCDFSGTATVICEACVCVVKENATDSDMLAQKKTLCANMDCQPVDDPEGAHFKPNTTKDHVSWVVGEFYKTHDWTYESCNNVKVVQLLPEACYPPPIKSVQFNSNMKKYKYRY